MKDRYESIEIEDLKFTIKWVGALIAEVSDDVDNNNDDYLNFGNGFYVQTIY